MKAIQFRRSLWRYGLLKLLGHRFPSLLTSPFGLVRLCEIEPLKLPSPYWVRVRPSLCGICGSDLAVITAKSSLLLSPLTSVPFVFGHEIVGEVIEVGSAVEKVKVGDRVVVEPALCCFVREIDPPCQRCAKGNYACCERVDEGIISEGVQTGYCRDTGGGWSEQLVAHEWQLFRVPDELDDEEVVLLEPFSCAIHAVGRALQSFADVQCLMSNDQSVFVIGCGTMGLLTIKALRALESALGRKPMRIFATDKYQYRREWALRFGAEEVMPAGLQGYETVRERTGARLFQPELGKPTVLGGVDIVFDCVGTKSSLDDAVRWTRANGVLVVVGMPAEPKVSWASIWFKELRVIGSYAYGVEDWQGERVRTFELALKLLQEGVVSLKGLVTHRFPLSRWRKAIQTALHPERHGAIKVTLHP